MYVMILEVVLVAILVFVVGPILFVRFGLPNFLLSQLLANPDCAVILEHPLTLSRSSPITKSTPLHTRHWTGLACCRRQTPTRNLHPSATRSAFKTGHISVRLAYIPAKVPYLAPFPFLAV